MIDYFRISYVRNDLRKNIIVSFLDFLNESKEYLCIRENLDTKDPLIASLTQDELETLIGRFFMAIDQNKDLQEAGTFEQKEAKSELVNKITKVLHSQNNSED